MIPRFILRASCGRCSKRRVTFAGQERGDHGDVGTFHVTNAGHV